MNTRTAVGLALLSWLLSACDRSVMTGGTASTGAGGGGGAASSHASTSSTTGSASSSGTGGQGCSGYIDVVEDNGAPVHWAAVCYGTWGAMSSTTAVGYLFSGGAPGAQALRIEGCENSGDFVASPGILMSASNAMSPGTYTKGTTSYIDSMGMSWGIPGDGFSMTVTKLDPVGGSIDGTFSGFVSNGGNAAHSLTATFHVCRVPELAP